MILAFLFGAICCLVGYLAGCALYHLIKRHNHRRTP